jgi:hypothetical protein
MRDRALDVELSHPEEIRGDVEKHRCVPQSRDRRPRTSPARKRLVVSVQFSKLGEQLLIRLSAIVPAPLIHPEVGSARRRRVHGCSTGKAAPLGGCAPWGLHATAHVHLIQRHEMGASVASRGLTSSNELRQEM